MSGFEWYLDFVKPDYTPSENDVIVLFRAEASPGFTFEEVVGRVASESSVGTWTTLSTPTDWNRIRRLMAKAYKLEKPYFLVAYPEDLFEEGSIPQILSSIAGNIFGMKALRSLRLVDFRLTKNLVKSFPGPLYGKGVRELLGVKDRPLLATVPKPKVGMDPDETMRASYEALVGGIDLIKDDENLTSQKFSRFTKRLNAVMKAIDKAEKETGEKKGYLVNVTAPAGEMEKRIKEVADTGNKFVMIDIITAGWAALQRAREVTGEYGLAIHAHRAMHAAFTRNPKHGITMRAVAKLARLAGVDHIHIGTVVGKLVSPLREVLSIKNALVKPRENDGKRKLGMDWQHIKPVLPVSSGGLHPGLIPDVMRILGRDIMIQVGGGVWGHPDGPRAGAAAVRQAIEAVLEGVPLEEKAKQNKELARALEKWGKTKPS